MREDKFLEEINTTGNPLECFEPSSEDCYNSEYNINYYRPDMGAVYIKWKKFCFGTTYREPLNHALELLKKYNAAYVVVDARNGFEDEKEDVEWAMNIYIPLMAKTSCKHIVFITEQGNIEGEIDMFTKEFLKYFKVDKCSSIEEAKRIITKAE